ncbi:MAG: alpha/beta hydrolase [Clostridiales bacterium]|nr:alpha/beta hydrolase [Clostridiales bacterium]
MKTVQDMVNKGTMEVCSMSECRSSLENSTLGALLSDPRIAPVAPDAIRARDLAAEPVWHMTLSQLREEHFFSGEIARGFERLYRAADTGAWYYPLYTQAECAAVPARSGVNVVWLPSDDEGADAKPFILLVPGGGFVNVWNLTEGWPIAEQFNRLGYHVFVLTYQVDAAERLLEKDMEDFARALRLIRKNEARFRVDGDSYITCGFSAGGYLVCLWNTRLGHALHALPRPRATFPVYPVTTLRPDVRYAPADPADALRLYGCPVEEAARDCYEIPEHVELFPPCAIFLAAQDELVDPENSRMLARALDAAHIPCRLEIGPAGGHGFADGAGMCMVGWTERAVRWYESLNEKA